MKRLFIAAVFSVAAYFVLREAKPTFAEHLLQVGGTQIAWGWITIAAAGVLGFVLGGKK